MTSHSAGVFAADEPVLGDLAAALGTAGYTIATRLTLEGDGTPADSSSAFEQWLDQAIEDDSIHLVVGTATDATRAAILARITKRVSGLTEIPGVDGGRCKDTVVIVVPTEAEARAAAMAFALPQIERELASESAGDPDPAPVKVSIPDRKVSTSTPGKPLPERMKDISGIAKLPPVDKEPSVIAKIPPVDKEPSVIAKIPPVDKEPSVVAKIPPVDKEPSVVAKIPPVARSPIPSTPLPKVGSAPPIPSTPLPKVGSAPPIPSTPLPRGGSAPPIPSTPLPKAATPPPAPATPPPSPAIPAGRKTPPPPPSESPRELMTEEIEPLSLDDIPEQAVAAPATKKSDDKRNVRKSDPIGRLFERTPAPSELTPIAAQAVAAADKAKADAKDKGALPELVVPETFSVATSPATSSAARSRRNLWIAIGLGAVAVIGATVVLLGHSSKPSGPAVAKASPKPAGKPADQPSTEPSHESGAPPTEPTAPTSDQPGSAAEQPTIDLPDDHVSPSMRPTATSGHASSATSSTSGTTSTSATVPATKPGTTGSTAAGSGAGKAGSGAGSSAKPGATVEAPVSADGCDKVSCVIDGYAKPCCEPFRPRKPGETPRELDRDMILAGMSKAKAAVIHCGEATPSAKGIVRLAMKVAPDGSVQDASVAESPDPTLGECVAAAVRKVTFAPTDQGGTFNYPFKF